MGIPAKTSSFSTGSFLAFREKKKKKKWQPWAYSASEMPLGFQ